MSNSFLKTHQKAIETLGFWTEDRRKSIIKAIELQYKEEVVKEWCISDFILDGDRVLLKWAKRFIPLSEQELKDNYGK